MASAAAVGPVISPAQTLLDAGNSGPESKASYHLVARELRPALRRLPNLVLDETLLQRMRQSGPLPPALLTPAQQSVSCQEHHIPHTDGVSRVRCLLYRPPGANIRRPTYLDIHGGGYVFGRPEQGDVANRTLALQLDCIVLSVDYALAPEARYPKALEDCYSALAWLHQQAHQLGIDPSRIAVGGSSAGAGHAVSLSLLSRTRGEFPIGFQLLDSPMLDDRTGNTRPAPPLSGEFVWTPQNNRFGWHALLGVEPGSDEVPAGAVPARVGDLGGLPPAFISVGTLDLFLDEDMEYARRLTRAGVHAELYVVPGAYHGFMAAGEDVPQVRKLRQLRSEALGRAWRTDVRATG